MNILLWVGNIASSWLCFMIFFIKLNMNFCHLFQVTSGFQWYIQVVYSIGPTDSLFRRKRSALYPAAINKRSTADETAVKYDWLESNRSKNGTNIISLHLNDTHVEKQVERDHKNLIPIILLVVAVILVVTVICCILVVLRKRRKKRHKQNMPAKRNNLELAQQNSVIYKGKQMKPVSVRCSSAVELKESVVYKADHGKASVRVKDTNIQKDKNISKHGTEV